MNIQLPFLMKKNIDGFFCANSCVSKKPQKAYIRKEKYFFYLLILTFFLQFLVLNSYSQISGNYRSNTVTMNWNVAASWQKYNGTSWVTSTDYPGQNACSGCTVTIQNAHTVTLNITPANSIGALVVGSGTNGILTLGTYTLNVAGNLTVNAGATINLASGTFSVGGTTSTAGIISDASNTGVNTFTGLITKTAGTWTSTSVTSASNMIFYGGFNNTAGAYTAGAATIGDNQTLTGTVNMSFANGITVLGNADLNIAGTTVAGVSFGGVAINYAVRNLSLTGLLTVSTSGKLTVSGTTSVTSNGAFTDNNNTGITSFAGLVTHNSSGNWTSTLVTTAANMVFTAGFTNTAGAFSAGGATIGNNNTLRGTVNMSFNNGITVLGLGDITIAGTANTGVTFAGTLINYSVRNLTLSGLLTTSTTGNLTVNGTVTASSTGGFLDNNGTGITTFTGLVTLGSTSTFTATAITTIGRLIFAGGITHNNTAALSFNAGTIRTSGTQTWSGAGDINSAAVLDVNVGTLTNNMTGTVTVGGTLTGTSFVQGTNSKLVLSNAVPLTITTLTSTATGNTVTYGGPTATMRSQSYYHLIVAGSGNKVVSTTDISVNGDLTINAGVLSNTTNNRNIILSGNWINNVGATGFTAGTGTVTFSGSTAQTLGGTGTTIFNNLTLNNATGINQSINSTIVGALALTAGIISTGSTTVIISSTGTVTRTSGYINGNEQRNIATGSNVARTFDIGDATNYTPVTLTFASVSVAGNVTVKSTGTEHPLIASAYLNTGLSINRYYTYRLFTMILLAMVG